jgi:hypothetical protein
MVTEEKVVRKACVPYRPDVDFGQENEGNCLIRSLICGYHNFE